MSVRTVAMDCELAISDNAPIAARILIFINVSDSNFVFLIGYLRGPAWIHF
jgi:hypothetical protein